VRALRYALAGMGVRSARRVGCGRCGVTALSALAAVAVVWGVRACPAAVASTGSAESAFAKAFRADLMKSGTVGQAIGKAIQDAGHDTPTQLATLLGQLANDWDVAIKPMVALRAPAPVARLFSAVVQHARAVAPDLRAMAHAASEDNEKAYNTAGQTTVRNDTDYATAVDALAKKLGITL